MNTVRVIVVEMFGQSIFYLLMLDFFPDLSGPCMYICRPRTCRSPRRSRTWCCQSRSPCRWPVWAPPVSTRMPRSCRTFSSRPSSPPWALRQLDIFLVSQFYLNHFYQIQINRLFSQIFSSDIDLKLYFRARHQIHPWERSRLRSHQQREGGMLVELPHSESWRSIDPRIIWRTRYVP